MPFVNQVLNRQTTGSAAAPSVSALHRELALLNGAIARTEISERRFGESTEASVREFQKRVGLRETGEVDPTTGGIIALATLAIEEGDRAKLREGLRNAVDRVPNSPEYAYWLARYAIMAGDYQTAYTVAQRFSDFGPIVAVITPILEVPDPEPSPPEVRNPENFYTYRYEFLPQAALTQLRRGVSELTAVQYKQDNEIEVDNAVSASELEDAKNDSSVVLEAMQEWQEGIQDSLNRQYARAAIHYESCQRAVVRYFQEELALNVTGNLDQDLSSVMNRLIVAEPYEWPQLWESIRWRRSLLSLKELHERDWVYPRGTDETYSVAGKYVLLFMNFSDTLMAIGGPQKLNVETRVIAPLILLACVFVPLARAEDNRLRRQFDAALDELDRLLAFNNGLAPPYRLLCEFIEIPFIRLLKAETLKDKAEAEYKARVSVRAEDRSILDGARNDFSSRVPDPENQNQAKPFQLLQAAATYLKMVQLWEDPAYVNDYVGRVNQGVRDLQSELSERLSSGDVTSHRFQIVAKSITIPTITIPPTSNMLPGLDRRVKPHQSLVMFSLPPGSPVLPESNPRVYSLLLEVQARLLQLWFGFNYLGYRDDYVPPWRFQYLLDRARYFCEHAKNAQREYVNFLGNAEREEFQELSTSQNVELEKSNVRIETARVDQVQLEVQAASESAKLADLAAQNAHDRLETYDAFDAYADRIMNAGGAGAPVASSIALGTEMPVLGAVIEGIGDFFTGGFFSSSKRKLVEAAQREVEKHGLVLAEQEANQSAVVAATQLDAARAGLLVAGLQRQAALLRHEFALQNLNFLRNRTLNAELWYRLSGAIRSVSETYLRYAIEMAFLAEQACEFEADKRINVIRFDYDVSELGDMLAGDFLLRDLDTLEQDLIVGQQLRQQQVRYVLSLAREYPEALQELRDNGQMMFSLRLEQLERRFPGLFNLRIAAVEVLPVALMDPTRFSLELTQLGSGQVRLKAQPDTAPGTESTSLLNTSNMGDWLRGLQTEWLVKLRVTGPETAVYSGLTRQDLAGLQSFFASNQRGAFEGLAGASAWRVDLSMKENRIVPGTLADLLVTFTLSGYYNASLRQAIDLAPRNATATTTWFSAHQTFPDAFYHFNRSGRMDWAISPEFLNLQGSPDAVRNVAVILPPGPRRRELGRVLCSYPVEFEVDAAGTVRLLTELPQVTLTTDGLTLKAELNVATATAVTWDFGDGTGPSDSSALPHTYARPGQYDVTLRLANDGRLFEYRAAVVVSRQHAVLPPLIVVPSLPATVQGGELKLEPSVESVAGEPLSVTWHLDGKGPDEAPGSVTFTLPLPTTDRPERHVLRFIAVRPLTGRFYSQQRYVPTASTPLTGLHLATNRTFDPATGDEDTVARNGFTEHVFGTAPQTLVQSPTDRWTLELPMEDNPGVVGVTSTDVKQYDLSELSDAVLLLEYNIRDA